MVGDILSGWRYDLTALSPDVRGAYVEHLEDCRHCRARQRLHRTIDVVLLSVFTVSVFAFLLATMIVHRGPWAQLTFAELHMRHLSMALTLQTIAVGGLLFSVLMWVLVAIATPAPRLITNTVPAATAQPEPHLAGGLSPDSTVPTQQQALDAAVHAHVSSDPDGSQTSSDDIAQYTRPRPQPMACHGAIAGNVDAACHQRRCVPMDAACRRGSPLTHTGRPDTLWRQQRRDDVERTVVAHRLRNVRARWPRSPGCQHVVSLEPRCHR